MKTIISLLLIILCAGTSYADVLTENTQLARINSVLTAIYPLINAAQKAAPKNTRLTFHYNWLREDIQAIQAGIAQKINHQPLTPQVVQPLTTQYIAVADKVINHP